MTEEIDPEIAQIIADAEVAAPPVEPEPPAPAEPLKILGRDEILDSDDLAHETVAVPEWGGAVIVRALTGSERDAYEAAIFTTGLGSGLNTRELNLQNVRARLCSKTIIDEKGRRLFSDGDIVELGLKSAAALQRVFEVAQRLSRLTPDDVKELEDQLGKGLSAASGSA